MRSVIETLHEALGVLRDDPSNEEMRTIARELEVAAEDLRRVAECVSHTKQEEEEE